MLGLDTLDITDARAYAEHGYPYREWDLLRREAPVFWYQRPGFESFWALTRHADVARVAGDPELFSSAQRMHVDTPDAVEREPEARHSEPVTPCVTPAVVASLTERLTEHAEGCVAAFAARLDTDGVADVARDLAARLAVAAVCELVGAPARDRDDVLAWVEGATGAADPEPGADVEAAIRRHADALHGYVVGLVQQRLSTPPAASVPHDVLSALARGRPVFHQVLHVVSDLVVAGSGTSRNATAGGIWALLEHPDQLARLVADPSLVDRAVEEVLRWTTTSIHVARTATQDTEIRGTRIRRGETVVMWFPSANRDEDVFPEPYRFDVGREPNPHLTFGGSGEPVSLARLQLRVLLRAVLPLLPDLELAGRPELVTPDLRVAQVRRLLVRRRAEVDPRPLRQKEH